MFQLHSLLLEPNICNSFNYTLALPEIFYPLETQLNNFFFMFSETL